MPTGVSGHSNAGIEVVGAVEGDTVVDDTGGSVFDATVVEGMFVVGTIASADVDGEAVTVGPEGESSVAA